MAKSKTSLVFSGGTCLRMIWPGSTSQSSRGMMAPFPTYRKCLIAPNNADLSLKKRTSTQIISGCAKLKLYVRR